MDQTGAAIVEAVSPYGLAPLLLVGVGVAVVAILCVFVLPSWKKNSEAQIEIERMKAEAQIALEREREERKAKESEREAEQRKKDSENDARIAVLMEGVQRNLEIVSSNLEHNNTLLEGSQRGSSKMGVTVEDTNRKVTELHHALIN